MKESNGGARPSCRGRYTTQLHSTIIIGSQDIEKEGGGVAAAEGGTFGQ